MAKDKLIVNGYSLPRGYGGVAVRRACELILAHPGIAQKDLLPEAAKFAGLNLSTAGWITSPGPKSPAGILWERRKETIFRCYPNEHTEKAVGAQTALLNEKIAQPKRRWAEGKLTLRVGDLVNLRPRFLQVESGGVVVGFGLGQMLPADPIFNSIDEIIATQPLCTVADVVYVSIMENGTGQVLREWDWLRIEPLRSFRD